MITFAALSFLLSKLAPSFCQNCVHFNQCSSTNHKNSCLFIKETTKCVSELARMSGDFEDNFEEYPICAQNYVKTDVRSFVVRSPEGADFVKINLTFNEINFRVEALAFRQKCSMKNVDSTTKIKDSDPLCSNHSRPQWNRFHWPCRIFRFEHQGNFLQYPLETLFYPCFHAGRESNLMNIHILVYPQACQFVYAYTVPQMTYGSFEFRPFLVTDTNSKNGSLILRYQFLGHFEWLMAKKELDILAEIDGKFASQRTVTENDDLSSFFVFTNLSNGRHVAAVQLLTEYCPDSMCPLTAIPFDIVNGVVAEREPKNIVDKKFVFSARIFVGLFILLFILCILASVAAVHYGTKLYKVRRKISRRGGIRRADVYE